MCEESAKPNYAYPRAQHVPTKEPLYSGRWIVHEKPKDVQKRNATKLAKDTVHKAIFEHGTRKRYTDFKICVLQVLNAKRQVPRRGTPFASEAPEA